MTNPDSDKSAGIRAHKTRGFPSPSHGRFDVIVMSFVSCLMIMKVFNNGCGEMSILEPDRSIRINNGKSVNNGLI